MKQINSKSILHGITTTFTHKIIDLIFENFKLTNMKDEYTFRFAKAQYAINQDRSIVSC